MNDILQQLPVNWCCFCDTEAVATRADIYSRNEAGEAVKRNDTAN